jgi:hypothetical protein
LPLIGNLGYPQKLVSGEVGVAIISSCLPSIFNLLKHGLQHVPYFNHKLSQSKSLANSRGAKVGPVGNPIEEQYEKGFIQLGELERGSARSGSTSQDRLHDDREVPDGYGQTTTLAAKNSLQN